MTVMLCLLYTVGSRRDNRWSIVLRKVLQQGIDVIGLVAQNGISSKPLDECLRMHHSLNPYPFDLVCG